MRIASILTALILSSSAAFAQEEPYLDDRSNPESLVRSLYNAIGRKEYARAWDYFGEQKPSNISRTSSKVMPTPIGSMC